MKDVIYSINGPVVTVKDTSTFGMAEMVYVGNAGLIGEVISVSEARTTIQVYENTTGLLVGEPVKGTGAPLSATLGPGIMENIFDGIERPLTDIAVDGSIRLGGVKLETQHILYDETLDFAAAAERAAFLTRCKLRVE